MARVVPTILATDADDYAARLDRVVGFADRVHIDICDGVFADNQTIGPAQVQLPGGLPFDLHLMLVRPLSQLETVAALGPQLVITHFESDDERSALVRSLRELDLSVGLAIKPSTTIDEVASVLGEYDQLLIFTGLLGHNGGQFDRACLDKIGQARRIRPELEIAVDGGIDQTTAALAIEAGADVLYSGSFIHDAADPAVAYAALQAIAGGAV